MRIFSEIFILFFFITLFDVCNSQTIYQFELTKTVAECQKGTAAISITGTTGSDTVRITWSNGQTVVTSISDLDAGDYQVNINILHKLDTNFFFNIEKIECTVSIGAYFTPNGDDINDYLAVTNAENYPNFELEIYNKWGQRIHSQKSKYVPWDGTWAGVKVPDGTYYYVFFYDASSKSKLVKGDITILR